MRKTLLAVISVISCLLSAADHLGSQAPATQRSAADRPSLRVGALTGSIEIDGRLEESVWLTADSIRDLTQIEPREGTKPSAPTRVRVLMNEREIVFGVRLDYPPGVNVVTFARERDAGLSNEDHIRIVLDTYLDGRSGYVFAVNANGARYDALVANQGEDENTNWDAVWQAATARTATGWSAEIVIPLRSLLFRPGIDAWGFNIQRRIQQLQETGRWASPKRNYEITQTSQAGLLTSLPSTDLGIGLSIRPSVKVGSGKDHPGASYKNTADLSLDANQRVPGNALASLTINTDFAETEVDTRRTNLTRFPLFFPEKRTFFLEGSDIFDFGLGLREDVIPFFSRRIGLLGGREIPIAAGGKLNGRAGGTNFGALAVRTRNADSLGTDQTMGVIRIRQNVLAESSLGVIATAGDPIGRANGWVSGVDATYQTSHFRGDENFLFGVWTLAMNREDIDGTRWASGLKIDYPNDLWDIASTFKRIENGFDPSLGFVPRSGVQIATLGIEYSPRPQKPIGPLRVRQMFYEFETQLVTNLHNRWESYEVFMAPVNWRLESGDRFEMNVVPTGERLPEDFEIASGVTIPAGKYQWNRYRLEAGTASKRRFSGQATWWFGGFYSGHLDELEVTAAWKPSSLFVMELSAQKNIGRLPEGDFTQDLVGTRVRLNFSSDLQLNSFVQYDNESHSVGTNTRLRWTFVPLDDLFVVYNHNLATRDELSRQRGLTFVSNQLLVKAQYTFRY